MKKLPLVVAALHVFLWVAFLIISIVESVTFITPENTEPLSLFLTTAIYNTFIIFSTVGIINALILFFSMKVFLKNRGEKQGLESRTAFFCSVFATMFFYLFVVLIFAINKDFLLIFPLLWLVCELCCIVLLIVMFFKRNSEKRRMRAWTTNNSLVG